MNSEARAASRRLLSASALMAAGTLVSRLFGFVRTALIAFTLGNATRQVDMFTLANTVPNSLYILIAGGALNAVLVPQLVRAIRNDDDGGEAYTNRMITVTLSVIGVITILITLAAPAVMWLWSGAAWKDPSLAANYQSMVMLAYFCLPQIFFYCAYVVIGQVLNAHDRFGPYMWAPIANNVVSIIVLGIYLAVWGTSTGDAPFTTGQELLLGLGSTLGIAVQALVLLPVLRQTGFHFRPRWDLRGSGLGHTFSLAKWTIAFVVVTQLALIVVNKLATNATAGGSGAGLTVYNNAFLLWMVPHSLITVSLATAMLPSASRMAADGNLPAVARESVRTMKLVVTALLPMAIGFMVLAVPISQLLFGNGAGAADAQYVGWTLTALAVGLVPFTLHYICTRTFYALEDTRTPFLVQCVIAVVNIGAALALVVPWNRPTLVAPGLALAYSIAYFVGFTLIALLLRRRLPGLQAKGLLRHLVRLTVATAPAALAAWGTHRGLQVLGDSFLLRLLALAGAGLAAVVIFIVMARLLHIDEVTDVLGMLRRRGRSAPPSDGADEEDTLTSRTPEQELEVGHPDAATWIIPAITEPHTDDVDTIVPRYGGETAPPADPEGFTESTTPVVAGDVLGRRYELGEVQATHGTLMTWVAFDLVLSRSVLVHLLPVDDPRAPAMLGAARTAAVTTDSRVLRVFDVVAGGPRDEVSYVVTEHSTGQSLETLLGHGVFGAREAGWVVREVAEAVSSMHSQGVHHQRISPRSVLVTDTGNVKLVGFSLDHIVEPTAANADAVQLDVEDLGRILYAMVAHRWPDEDAHGLRAAPEEHGHPVAPRRVRAGVPPALDTICQQILGDPDRTGLRPISTATGVARALTTILGTTDASRTLEHRIRYPQEPDTVHPVIDARRQADAEPTRTHHEPPPEPKRRWLLVLVGLVIVVLIASLFAVALRGQFSTTGDAPTTTPTASAGPVRIVKGVDFDPEADQGNGEENPADVPKAFDGDPQTGWRTLEYYGNRKMGGLKPGVGVIVEFAEPVEVTTVRLHLLRSGSDLSLRVPADPQADEPPMTSQRDWHQVGAMKKADEQVDITVDEPTTTRFLLIYFTALPSSGENAYRGGINEIEVNP